jgi:pyruvate dehydrogenase (quinone)
VGAAWDEALAEKRPVVIDAKTDPEVPTLPPHISLEQAKNFAKSILKGDPNARAMIRESYKQTLDAWAPRRRIHKHADNGHGKREFAPK